MRNLTLWFDVILVILMMSQRRLTRDNYHIRRGIVELDQILIDLPVHIFLHSWHRVKEWSRLCGFNLRRSHFIPLPSVWHPNTQWVSAGLCLFTPFLSQCLFSNRNYSDKANDSVYLLKLLLERLKREQLYLHRPDENEHCLMYWCKNKCVPTQIASSDAENVSICVRVQS